MANVQIYFQDVNEGDELPALVKGPIERIQLVKYAGASGDFNPIHVDEEYAKSAGMKSVFAHGMLSMGPGQTDDHYGLPCCQSLKS